MLNSHSQFGLSLISLLCISVAPVFADNTNSYLPFWRAQPPNITDLALIYQGGSQRPQWTVGRYAPYVSYRDPKSGKEHWLYDGFLFIEFADGKGHAFEPSLKMRPAEKAHWLKLLEKNFAENDGVPNLEKICRETAARIGQPARRRQAILSIPEPIVGQTNWGELHDRALDFRKSEDRVAAVRWYVDLALQKWKELAPQQLDLAGFYRISEQFPRANSLHIQTAKLVHERGKQFFWIPYWQGRNTCKEWRSLGFDAAWLQPNYFFHPKVAESRFDEVCSAAKANGMGLEMEFDERMLDQPELFERRFDDYLDAFTTHGVAQSSSIAYYEGGGTIFRLANSPDRKMRAHYDRIARFILDRQTRADKLATKK